MPVYSAEEYNRQHGHKLPKHPLPTDCATSNYPRLLHGGKTWKFLQNVFHEQSYAKKSYHHRIHARHRHQGYSGVEDDYIEARDDGDGRGRGMYAIRDIPRGTKTWYFGIGWMTNDGEWSTRESMLGFLERLPHDLQCDVLLWAYAVQPSRKKSSGKKGERFVECNLDEASFFNHGERPDLVNIEHNRASRDIEEGEELLMDYGSFIALGEEALPWWDEIRNTAWKEGEVTASTPITVTDGSNGTISGPTASTKGDALAGVDDCMNGYVNYGKPKPISAGFVDATPIGSTPAATSNGFATTLVSLILALVLANGFVATGRVRRS